MEGKKLEKKIRDWASDLNFKLPNGSTPPTNYFSLLITTPHRRQLWETLMEFVHPRQKTGCKKKQIMVAELKDRNKCSRKCDSASIMSRVELWHQQIALENQIKEKRNEIMKLEGIIFATVSDVLFEICKVAELEKLYEESSEKALSLGLLTKREKDFIKSLEKILLKVVKAVNCGGYFETSGHEKNNLEAMKNELSAEEWMSPFNDDHDCNLGHKLKDLWMSGNSEKNVWEQVVKCKETLLIKSALFVEELNSNEKSVLSEKELGIEERLSVSIRQLKQRAIAKSLKVILNSTEGQTLDWEIEKLGEKLFKEEPKGSPNETFTEPISPLPTGGTSESLLYSDKAQIVRRCVSAVGLRCYKELLGEETKRLEEGERAWEKEDCKKAEKELERTVTAVASFDGIIEEISSERSKEGTVEEQIFGSFNRLVCDMRSLGEEAEEKKKARAIDDAEKVICGSGKLIDVFMETSLDLFKTVGSCSGRLLFECESLSNCLNSYGGELKQYFSAMLIPPRPNSRAILSEVEVRRRVLTDMRHVIRHRDELTQLQRKIEQRMDLTTLDTRLCNRNFEESAGILWNVLFKSDELLQEAGFIESILRNWVEQPYRWMAALQVAAKISDTRS